MINLYNMYIFIYIYIYIILYLCLAQEIFPETDYKY